MDQPRISDQGRLDLGVRPLPNVQPVDDEQMLTPSSIAAEHMRSRGIRRSLVLGGPGVGHALREAGIQTLHTAEEGATQGFGTEARGSRNGLHRAHGCVSRMRRSASAYTADALATLGACDAVKLAQPA